MKIDEAISMYKKLGQKVFGDKRMLSMKGKLAPRCKSEHLEACLQYVTQQDRLDLIEGGDNRRKRPQDFPKSRKDHDIVKSLADGVTLDSGNPDATRT
jgi:hypothetical protein